MIAPRNLRSRAPRAIAAGAVLLAASVALAQAGFDDVPRFGGIDAQWSERHKQLEEQRARKAAAEHELSGMSARSQQAVERLQRNARTLYRVSRGGMLPVAGGVAALLGHASRVSRLEQLVRQDLEAVQQLRRHASGLESEIGSLQGQIQAAERDLAALSAARIGAARERALSSSLEAALSGVPAPQALPSRAQYGLSIVGGDLATERFTEQRGNLALPISGPTRIEDASRDESDGPGLEFSGNPGAAVRAVAAGRVAFAESYGSYGKLVIVEHGERYYSVYGGMERFDVQVGDAISKSARLGGLGAAPLYFEVRRGTKTQDARAWLGL